MSPEEYTVDNVKLYRVFLKPSPAAEEPAAEEPMYDVDAILDHYRDARGRIYYLTRYTGYPEASWEPATHFKTGGCITNVALLHYLRELKRAR